MVTSPLGEMPNFAFRTGRPGWLVAGRWVPCLAGAEDPPADPHPAPSPPAAAAPPAPPPAPTPPPAPSQDDDEDEKKWDHARGMATITKLRADLKAAREAGKEVDTLKARLKDLEDAQLSDAEKTQREAAAVREERDALKAERDRLAAEREQDRLHRAIERAARVAGFADPDDAVRFLDVAALERDDDGQPKGLDKALKALLEAKPYLKGASGNGHPPGVPPTPKPGEPKPLTDDERRRQAASVRSYW